MAISEQRGEGVLGNELGNLRPIRPPGCLWLHTQTRRYYWQIASRFVPEDLRGTGRYTNISMVPKGARRGTRSKAVADKIRRALWKQWGSPQVSTEGSAHWLRRFQRWHTNRAGPKTVRRAQRIAGGFLESQGIENPTEISGVHIEAWLDVLRQRKLSTRTVQAYRNVLRLFCRYLVTQRVLDTNPVDAYPVRAPAKTPPRYLRDDQVAGFLKALQHAPVWLSRAARLALYAGPRLSSLRALRGEDVGPRVLTIPAPKTGTYGLVPIDEPIIGPGLREVIDELPEVKASELIFPEAPDWKWVQCLREITGDLPMFGELEGSRVGNQFHLLRSTWAVTCASRGASPYQLMAWGGWSTLQIVMRYVNIGRAAGLE